MNSSPNPNSDVADIAIAPEKMMHGKYRGVAVSIPVPQIYVRPYAAIGLKYRGTSYLKLS
jgi:hypothetical protein